MKKIALLVVAAALTLFALAGCGDDEQSSESGSAPTTSTETGSPGGGGGGGGETVAVSADPSGSLAYEQSSLEAKAGSPTFEFANESSTPHDFTIEDSSGLEIAGTEVISGDSTELTVDLEAGDYTFFCTIGGHRPAGMEGTLTVK